jgi:cytochrome b
MADKRLVWDLPLRAFHWLLVLSLIGLWTTAKADADYMDWLTKRFDVTWMEWHFRIGYFVIGLITFRIIWGFVGPRHARFVNFIPGPARFFAYLGSLFKRDSKHSIGHNPVGALMVLVILAAVGLQAFTGLFTSDDVIWAGPYNPAVSSALANKMGAIHHLNYIILLWIVSLHVLAIVFYAVYKRQRLVPPMINGYKPAAAVPQHEAIGSSQLFKALIVALLCAGAVTVLVKKAPEPPEASYN